MENDCSEERVGEVIDGRYKVLALLGKGGMGTVFRAQHIAIGRQVALKVLDATLAKSDDFLIRFQREAIAAGRLNHRNCVPVTDSGQLVDGSAYLVMELVEGQSLGRLLEEFGALEPQRALKIARHILRGLGHAHEAGIVHRDVKPDNIMLESRDGENDLARVLDFGIAKLHDADQDEAALTQVGVAVGTPTYLSPEQAFGETIDQRSDLYSVAVVLFEMLCGRPPYVSNNPMGVLTKHISAPIPMFYDVAPHLLISPVIENVVRRGLEKGKSDRFQSASEFIAAIDGALTSQGFRLATEAPDLSSTEELEYIEASPAARKNRWARIGVVAGLVCLVVILVGSVIWTGSDSNDENASLWALAKPDLDQRFEEAALRLKDGKTCKERLNAVVALRELGDKRAIPLLKKARRRMRGGVLGVGKKNSNHCLRKTIKDALANLEEG